LKENSNETVNKRKRFHFLAPLNEKSFNAFMMYPFMRIIAYIKNRKTPAFMQASIKTHYRSESYNLANVELLLVPTPSCGFGTSLTKQLNESSIY
jgi:hypothetical protein